MRTPADPAARFVAVAADPHAVVRLLLEGLVTLERDAAVGEALLAQVVSKDQLGADGRLRDREALRRLTASRDIARSYVGATATGDYAWDGALRVTFDAAYSAARQGVDYPEPGHAKLFVASGGADTPRPVELRRNGQGQWKVTGWSSLTVGVRRGATAAGDF